MSNRGDTVDHSGALDGPRHKVDPAHGGRHAGNGVGLGGNWKASSGHISPAIIALRLTGRSLSLVYIMATLRADPGTTSDDDRTSDACVLTQPSSRVA